MADEIRDPRAAGPPVIDAKKWTGRAEEQALPHRVDGISPLQRLFERRPWLAALCFLFFLIVAIVWIVQVFVGK
jgi:hypothetical protein